MKVEKLAKVGCTTAEIADVLGCSSDTIERRYRVELEAGRNQRNANLRVIQFKLAEKSAAMAIFLGKNYLAQRDTYDLGRLSDDELLRLARAAGIVVGASGTVASSESVEDGGGDTN